MSQPATIAYDRSLLLDGTVQLLFAAVPFGDIQERGIFNAGSHDMWWTPFSASSPARVAAANGLGSFKLAAGEGVILKVCNAITIIGTAADNVSAWER